jgi:hypothetical protein
MIEDHYVFDVNFTAAFSITNILFLTLNRLMRRTSKYPSNYSNQLISIPISRKSSILYRWKYLNMTIYLLKLAKLATLPLGNWRFWLFACSLLV